MNEPLFMNIGAGELVVIALVALLVFGGKKLPEVMRGLGKGVRSFREGISDVEDKIREVEKEVKDE